MLGTVFLSWKYCVYGFDFGSSKENRTGNFPMWNCDNRAQLMKKSPLTMYYRVQAVMRSP